MICEAIEDKTFYIILNLNFREEEDELDLLD